MDPRTEEDLMLKLPGSSALSAFRIARLLARLQALEPAVRALQAQFLHFVDCSAEPACRIERALLEQLLDDGGDACRAGGTRRRRRSRCRLLVVPRPGTISPWSSKATDIAHVCGLRRVRRIERGILYTLELQRSVAARAPYTRWPPRCTTA